MATYEMDFNETTGVLTIGFGDPADGDKIVVDAAKRLDMLIENGIISGGEVVRINGPATVAVGMVLAHRLAHLYQAVALYDPKLGKKYIVTIAHGDKYRLGDVID